MYRRFAYCILKKEKIIKKIKSQLAEALQNYLGNAKEFSEYYPDMNVLISPLYKAQLKEILKNQNASNAKSFELYLDTIIINMHTKVRKYKKSIYFDDENIKEIENQGFAIPFYIDEEKNIYVLLGILNPEIN